MRRGRLLFVRGRLLLVSGIAALAVSACTNEYGGLRFPRESALAAGDGGDGAAPDGESTGGDAGTAP